MTILIAEDDTDLRRSMVYFLSKLPNLKILEAKDGCEALNMIRAEKIDILVTDIQMPNITGLELLAILRSENIEVATIICSAHDERNHLLTALRLHVLDFIPKPFRIESFIETVSKAIEKTKQGNKIFLRKFALKPQQLSILELILEDYSNAQIAEKVNLSEPTIKYHVGQLLEYFKVSSRIELKKRIFEEKDKKRVPS